MLIVRNELYILLIALHHELHDVDLSISNIPCLLSFSAVKLTNNGSCFFSLAMPQGLQGSYFADQGSNSGPLE